MKKKSLISMIVALSLTATVMVGATLAYLTSQTETVTNTFTVGSVNIDLEEPDWNPEDGENLTPGVTIPKDPTVTNIGRNDAYVAIKVSGMDQMSRFGFSATVNNGWVLVNADGSKVVGQTDALTDGIYVYAGDVTAEDGTTAFEGTVLAAGAEAPELFSNVAFAGSDAYNTTYVIKEIANDSADQTAGTYFVIRDNNGKFMTNANEFTADDAKDASVKTFNTKSAAEAVVNDELQQNVTFEFNLDVTAYAIQTTDVASAPTAWVPQLNIQ